MVQILIREVTRHGHRPAWNYNCPFFPCDEDWLLASAARRLHVLSDFTRPLGLRALLGVITVQRVNFFISLVVMEQFVRNGWEQVLL